MADASGGGGFPVVRPSAGCPQGKAEPSPSPLGLAKTTHTTCRRAGNQAVRLRADVAVTLEAGVAGAEMLVLQGRPIGEPVVNHGPFVMNTREEIQQTIADYQRTQFGGWPWASDDPVHAREQGRFARRPDGKIERPG